MEELRTNLSPRGLVRVLLASEIKTTGKTRPGMIDADHMLIPHNTINRLTDTVEKDGGGFFHSQEVAARNKLYDIYVKTKLDWEAETIREIFSLLGKWGYGKDRSTGKGQFIVKSISEEHLPGEGNAVMALSHFVPDGSLSKGYYELYTKYGKLGGHYSQGNVAFPKTPLLLLKPGAIFKVSEKREFYGQSLGPVHPELEDVRQQTYLFPYFLKMGDSEK
ncbi:MAG: hypothetical protein JRH06_17200 [Deltaproteobacteria bacterium]|nr:hypothetical protein [Deltaproteobacteria bacterium]